MPTHRDANYGRGAAKSGDQYPAGGTGQNADYPPQFYTIYIHLYSFNKVAMYINEQINKQTNNKK